MQQVQREQAQVLERLSPVQALQVQEWEQPVRPELQRAQEQQVLVPLGPQQAQEREPERPELQPQRASRLPVRQVLAPLAQR